MKPIQLLIVINLFVHFSFGQSIPFKGNAKVLECSLPNKVIKFDLISEEGNDFIITLPIDGTTKIVDKKGKPIDIKDILPGTSVELQGEKVNYKTQVKEVKILTPWIGEEIELDGVFEAYNVETKIATVDGQKVKLGEGVVIKGISKFKGSKYSLFSDVSFGNFIECKGLRDASGTIIATKASVSENEYDKYDKELRSALEGEFSDEHLTPLTVPKELEKYTNSLHGGYVRFGDAKFKLLDNLKVQAYVSYVGNKVVPQWQKDIPFDAPERLRFRFYVIENPTFNAFALPNGMVFVHTGLLAVLDNEAQLAAVLGHEAAHATYEHAKERYEIQQKREKVFEIGETALNLALQNIPDADIKLARLLTSDLAQDGIQATIDMAKAITSLPPQTKEALKGLYLGIKGIASNGHSQDRENQSDRVGLFYMQQAGYDPRQAAEVWRKFMDTTAKTSVVDTLHNIAKEWMITADMYPYKNPLQSAGDYVIGKMAEKLLDNWFSSHPKAKTRYRNINLLVATNYNTSEKDEGIVGEEEYKEIKKLVTTGLKKRK